MATKLEELTQGWLVVPTGGADLDAIADRDDLRVLDEEFDTGVKALFAGDDDSIVAFLFSPGHFDEKKAKAWDLDYPWPMVSSRNMADLFSCDQQLEMVRHFRCGCLWNRNPRDKL